MYFLSAKRIFFAILMSISIVDLINSQPLENQQERDDHAGEIKEARVQIKGLVGTAYTTGVINALQGIKGVAMVIVTDFKQGLVKVILRENNSLSFIDLQKQIIKNIESSQCLCSAVKEIMVTGVIEEDEHGFFLHVGKTNEKMYIILKNKNFKKFNSRLKSLSGKESLVTLVGTIHSHSDGVIVIDSIKELNG